MRWVSAASLVCAALLGAAAATAAPVRAAGASAVVHYRSAPALEVALRAVPRAHVVRRLPALRAAEVRPAAAAAALARRPGILQVDRPSPRTVRVEPALDAAWGRSPFEWQYAAARVDAVPDDVLRAAAAITIAVVDTGAALDAPDLAAKQPATYDVRTRQADVRDANGHGTFVASLAAGSPTNGEGIAGFGGDARLLVVRAGRSDGSFMDFDEAAGIVYAVNYGARVVNLSLGGRSTSRIERSAIAYAVARGVLLVAAVGNERRRGNPVEYPAALLQPPRSNGVGGAGLAVAASTPSGRSAEFSNTGSWVSLAAPGDGVFAAVSPLSSPTIYPRAAVPWGGGGLYGFASGSSFASPEVAGAAALVWAANPMLTAQEVAQILKATASGRGTWTRDLGFGVIDVAAAVAAAQATAIDAP